MRTSINLLTLLALIVVAGCTTGCMTTSNFKNADGTLNTNRIESVKNAFKSDVAASVALTVTANPTYRIYFEAAQGAICDLNASKQFGPSQVSAALSNLRIPALGKPEALIGRSLLLHAYDLAFANESRIDLPPNTFRQALTEVMCEGITEGLAGGP